MSKTTQDQEPDQVRPTDSRVHYTSFLLRCWRGEEGQVHARLFDLRTGVGHAVGSLALLPELVRRLVTNAPLADSETQAEESPGVDQINPNDRR